MESRPLTRLGTVARALTLMVAAAIAGAAMSSVSAHDDGTTAHLWMTHLKPMHDPGTINTATNPVHWTKLQGVPAGFADGVDSVGAAGLGLKKAFDIFFVDISVIQKRIATACPTGQAIKAVDNQGAITCSTGSRGFSKTVSDTGKMCNGYCTEGTLTLSQGTWFITAKIGAFQEDGGFDYLNFDCKLDAGGLSDFASIHVEMSGLGTPFMTVPMQLVATLSSNLNASVSCEDYDHGEAHGRDLSIMAIRLSN